MVGSEVPSSASKLSRLMLLLAPFWPTSTVKSPQMLDCACVTHAWASNQRSPTPARRSLLVLIKLSLKDWKEWVVPTEEKTKSGQWRPRHHYAKNAFHNHCSNSKWREHMRSHGTGSFARQRRPRVPVELAISSSGSEISVRSAVDVTVTGWGECVDNDSHCLIAIGLVVRDWNAIRNLNWSGPKASSSSQRST